MNEALDLKMQADIAEQVRERFRQVSQGPGGHFTYPTGREGLQALGYDEASLGRLPHAVQEYFCGVGNPFSSGLPQAGDSVLDVGCGAGVDALVAAASVGPQGHVSGLEFSPDMIARAQANAEAAGFGNVTFVPGTAESLPFADQSFDLVVSNGVYNLVLRKRQALAEAFRVLRPGGRLQVADQILVNEGVPPLSPQTPSAWAG